MIVKGLLLLLEKRHALNLGCFAVQAAQRRSRCQAVVLHLQLALDEMTVSGSGTALHGLIFFNT